MGVALFYRRVEVVETCSYKTYRKFPKQNSTPDVFYNIHFPVQEIYEFYTTRNRI